MLISELYRRTVTAIIAGMLFFGTYLASPLLFSSILFIILLIILITEWPLLCRDRNHFLWYILPLYPITPIFILIYLTLQYYAISFLLPLYPFIIAWIADSGAYLVGKIFGSHKICPRISPGKSWEGLMGGIIVTFLANYYFFSRTTIINLLGIYSLSSLIIFSFLITIIGFLGDISISYLKRRVSLKDTSNILPGHGGLLDRFDAVFFIAPFILLLLLAHKS